MNDAPIDEVLEFWFSDAVRERWFRSTPALDDEIRDRFLPFWEQAREGKLAHWEQSPRGALALVIVLDQFPLNMFRDRAESFCTESDALAVAERAIDQGFDDRLRAEERYMLYMPFMHSEDLEHQDRAVALFEAAGLDRALEWARHHRALIARFGRFPHRNAILGRTSTSEERHYLESEDAFTG